MSPDPFRESDFIIRIPDDPAGAAAAAGREALEKEREARISGAGELARLAEELAKAVKNPK